MVVRLLLVHQIIMKHLGRFAGLTLRRTLRTRDRLFRACDKYLGSAPKAVVLVYHRVADLASDPLFLAVRPETFESHVRALKERFEIVSAQELINRIKHHALKGKELAITFDDGYKDNMTEALPIAEKYQVPITIFITTGIFDSAAPFSWDGMYGNTSGTYLNKEEAAELARNPVVTIGSHTVHHPRLRDLSPEAQQSEIGDAKAALESIIGKPVQFCAYPFGGHLDINSASKKAARGTGHEAAFTTVERTVGHSSSPFSLPRINIREMSAEKLLEKIRHFK